MRTNISYHLTSLLFTLFSTCAIAQSAPDSLRSSQPQGPDTLITVTKLPYPEAKIFPPAPSPGGALIVARGGAPAQSAVRNPSNHEQSEHPLAAAKSPIKNRQSPIANLDSCIRHRHTRLRQAELATLQQSKKGRWLKYLPTVRAGLAPAFRQDQDGNFTSRLTPTLSLGLNSNLLYTAHRDKQQRLATREAIIQRSQLQQDLEIAKLHRLQRRLQTETDKLNLQTGVADIDRQLFTLYTKQYENHDISPEEYLLKRKSFLQQELRNQDQIARIEAIQYEIEELAGCLSVPVPSDDLPSRK